MKTKKLFAVITASVLALSLSTVAFAASKDVTYKFVDSNSYTFVDSVTKASKTSYASVKITKFYKADGNPTDDYSKAYFQLGSNGGQADAVSCSIDTTKKLTLKGTYNQKGKTLNFYAKGNNASLDCYVDATLNADVN